ncbi:MAG: penicillin-binding transpeptidase domain-containing protein [bacterium]
MAFGSQDVEQFELTRRLTPLLLLFIAGLSVVAARILYLQVGMGESLRKKSQKNRIEHDVLPAKRGIIVDRNGEVLAADEPVYNLRRRGNRRSITRSILKKLAEGLEIDFKTLRHRVFEDESRIIVNGMTDSQKIWFAEHSGEFDAFEIQIRPRRVYRYGTIAAPVLGYTGEINPRELDKRRAEGLSQGKYVGKTGIEKYYDSTLQGEDGIRWVETTANGEAIRVLDSPTPISPDPGDSIALHLDIRLQRAVAKSFPSDSEGAVVVMEIPSGKVRALYSHPNYNPNDVVAGDKQLINELMKAKEDPFHNRVIQSRFPPGSTFKILPFMVASADTGYSTSNEFYCNGEHKLGNQTYKCWKEEGHGSVTLNQSLIHSCNIYYYNLVEEMGFNPIKQFAETVGFSRKTNIDLPGEVKPQLSTPSLKASQTTRPWTEGDALNAVIGQGYTLISPIKQAQLLGSLLTDRWIIPGVKKGAAGTLNSTFPPSDPTVDHLVTVMDDVTDEGTGYWAQHDENYQRIGVDIIGKTGTVQKVKVDDDGDTPPSDAWFVSAAPKEDPSYVVSVFLAESGSGGSTAAPHARGIYRSMIELGFFNDDR